MQIVPFRGAYKDRQYGHGPSNAVDIQRTGGGRAFDRHGICGKEPIGNREHSGRQTGGM